MKRALEIFSAGCPVCQQAVTEIRKLACPSCEITVHDLRQATAAARAEQLGAHSLPAVAVDGVLVGCCQSRGIDLDTLRAAGVGSPTL